MHQANSDLANVRERRRELRDRVSKAMTAHAQAAMAELGGRIKRAADIFSARLDADLALHKDMDELRETWAQLGWSFPSLTVGRRRTSKRAAGGNP